MLLVRNVFRLKYGDSKAAVAALKEGQALLKRLGLARPMRVLTDLIGPSYTVVLEDTVGSLQEFEAESHRLFGNAEWSAWYHEKMVPHIESGYREVWTVVD